VTREHPELIPDRDGAAMRWMLELPGTSPVACRQLEAAVAEVGWTHLQTRTDHAKGHTRLYIVTDPGESAQHLAVELAEHGLSRLPVIGRLESTTWSQVAARLRSTQDARVRAGGRVVIPKAG